MNIAAGARVAADRVVIAMVIATGRNADAAADDAASVGVPTPDKRQRIEPRRHNSSQREDMKKMPLAR